MKRAVYLIPALVLIALLAGCSSAIIPEDPMAKVLRANAELQRQVEAQSRVIYVCCGVLILLGASLAVSLGALWWTKGGRPSTTSTERAAAN